MADLVIGNVGTLVFEVRDGSNNLDPTAQSGDNTATLYRRFGSGNYAVAPEGVSITSRAGGRFDATFTPGVDANGYIYYLSIVDKYSKVHTKNWSITGVAPVDLTSSSFCSIQDVQQRVQRGAFTDTTNPTRDEVLQFMADAAKEIEAKIASVGPNYTVPSGVNPIPVTGQFNEYLTAITRQANAIKAAFDCISAQSITLSKELPERAKLLAMQYKDIMETLVSYIEKNYKTGGRTAISTGSSNNQGSSVQW